MTEFITCANCSCEYYDKNSPFVKEFFRIYKHKHRKLPSEFQHVVDLCRDCFFICTGFKVFTAHLDYQYCAFCTTFTIEPSWSPYQGDSEFGRVQLLSACVKHDHSICVNCSAITDNFIQHSTYSEDDEVGSDPYA